MKFGLHIWLLGLLFTLVAGPVMGSDVVKPVRIGATVSLEGAFEEPSDMGQKAFKYWLQEVNARGGLLGRPVELVLYDDKSDADLAGQLYTRLIEEDKVDLVFSPYSSPLTMAASKACEKNEKLMLAIAAAAEKPWQQGARYLFQLYAPGKRQFVGLLDLMARKNYRKVAVIHNNQSVFNREMAEGVREWAKKFRVDVVYDKSYHDGKAELPVMLEEIRATGVDGLINSSYPPDSYELLRLLGEMGYRPAVLGMPIVPVHPDFVQKVGPIGDGIMGPSQWEPDERIPFPGTKEFIVNFMRFAGHEPSFHAASAYSGCQLLERAVNATGTLDNKALRDYVAALDTVTVLGRFKVDPTGLQVGHNSFMIQWQNGKKEIIWPGKMKTAAPRL